MDERGPLVVKSLSHVWLFAISVHGILQARILEWVSMSFSRGSSQPRNQTRVSHIAGRRFILWATREAHKFLLHLFKKKKNGSILIIKSLKWRDILLFIYLLNPFLSPKTSSPTLCVYVSGAKSSQSLCDPTDCSPPGFSVHGIVQARILEWIAFPFSRESSQPRDWTWVSCIAGRFFTIWATWEASLIGQLPYRWPSLSANHVSPRCILLFLLQTDLFFLSFMFLHFSGFSQIALTENPNRSP